MTMVFEKNLQALRDRYPALYHYFSHFQPVEAGTLFSTPDGSQSIELTRPGKPPVQAYQSSPWKEASGHLDTVPADSGGLAVVVGMGLGYGALLLMRERPVLEKLVILEPSEDLFYYAMQAVDLTPLFQSEKVVLCIGNIDWEFFKDTVRSLAAHTDTYILRHQPSFAWKNELYKDTDQTAFGILNELNVAGGTATEYGLTFLENRLQNLTLARHSHPLAVLKDAFRGVPAVLVSSGPSLDESLPYLKTVADKCVLIAVDGALAPLLKENIVPDFVTAIDIKESSFEKVTPFLNQDWPWSLVALLKVTPLIPKRLPAKYVFWASEDDVCQKWINEAMGINATIPYVSSVAHLSLALALELGADPIITAGQDLAYKPGASQHAAEVINARPGIPQDAFPVAGINGEQVYTDRALYEIRTRLESIFSEHPGTYINASAYGAAIKGTIAMDFPAVRDRYLNKPVATVNILRKCVPAAGTSAGKILARCQHTLTLIRELEPRLSEAIQKAREISKAIAPCPASPSRSLPEDRKLSVGIRKQIEDLNRLNQRIEKYEDIWEQVTEMTLQAHINNEKMKAANQNRQTENFTRWLEAELARLCFIQETRLKTLGGYGQLLHRLSSHLEEEEKLLGKLARGEDPEVLTLLVAIYLNSKDFVCAKKIHSQLKKVSASAETFFLEGAIEAGLLNFKAAFSCWETCVSVDSRYADKIRGHRLAEARYWVVQIEKFGSGRHKLCRNWVERALVLAGGDREVVAELNNLWEQDLKTIDRFLAARKPALAEPHLLSWEPVGTIFPEWHERQSLMHQLRGHRSGAIESLQAALEINPDNASWQAGAARLLLEDGRFEEAFAHLDQAVRLDPSTALLWEEIGDVLLEAQDFSGAATAYQRCFLALPGHLQVLAKIGNIYLLDQKPEAAIAAYESFLQKEPGNHTVEKHLLAARQMQKLFSGQ